MLLRLLAFALAGVCLHAQSAPTDLFEKAPPEVDEALRARVSKFYQAQVDGKFRLAEQEVAEDSKDFYYKMEKTQYLSFEILKINYAENFTKATVVVGIELDWKSPRMGSSIRVKPPMTSLWKIENGEWCWYYVVAKEWKTPYGVMNVNPSGASGPPSFKGVDPKAVMAGVRVDKEEIQLSGTEKSTGEATIENTIAGEVQLELGIPTTPGLTAALDKKVLKKGEQAKLTLTYAPPNLEPKTERTIRVIVRPTNQQIPIRLSFAAPPVVAPVSVRPSVRSN